MDGEHSVESPSRANVVEQSGDLTQKLPGLSPKNAEIAAATTETSAATPSATPPPPPISVEAKVDASEISGNSTQRTISQECQYGS